MPEREILEKFKVYPTFDKEKYLLQEIEDARNFLNNELNIIDRIEDNTLQLICIFSLIDCLAQEYYNYPNRESKQAFCDFVIKYQKQCDYLEQIEPVTLYYRVEDCIDTKVMIDGFPPEKEVSLENLGWLDAVLVKDILKSNKSEEISNYLKRKYSEGSVENVLHEHKLISLIYRMRSKAVHEMSGLGESFMKMIDVFPNEPYYRDVSRLYVYEGNVVSDDVFELVIPNKFLRNILSDCIEGYLEDCKIDKHSPFSNNNISRLYRLSWHDTLAKLKN